MLVKTHDFIIRHALQLSSRKFRKHRKLLRDGCVLEDYPKISSKEFQILGMTHFYNPESKSGYPGLLTNAKKKGLSLFNEALSLYKQEKFNASFYTLGRSAHYLMDMASPSHTKLLFHLAEDDFEIYVDQNIHKFKFKIRSKLIKPTSPEDCFEKLAFKSYKSKYKKRNKVFRGLIDFITNKKQPDPDKKLNRISKKLIKHSIVYTVALLNAFNRKIIKYKLVQKQKRFVNKIKTKSKDLVS